jgi:hypothetical protein
MTRYEVLGVIAGWDVVRPNEASGPKLVKNSDIVGEQSGVRHR